MNQLGKPPSAAEADAGHLSKLKLAAIVTAVCAMALAVVAIVVATNHVPGRVAGGLSAPGAGWCG
jgi:hypothetical protein